MEQVLYVRLDQRSRVIFKNFWYITQARFPSGWKKQCACRSLDGAVAAANV